MGAPGAGFRSRGTGRARGAAAPGGNPKRGGAGPGSPAGGHAVDPGLRRFPREEADRKIRCLSCDVSERRDEQGPMRDRKLNRLFLRWRERGDAEALGEVFDRTAPELLRVALHVVRDPAEADDLLQATFL